jgi:hypothetical protein
MRGTYLAALALLIAGCSWMQAHKPRLPEPHAPTSLAEVGKIAPDLDGEDTTGQRLHLADYRGNVVVVQFWANW